MKRILLFGAPGSGKGTQGELLREKYGYLKISTGDLIREEVRKKSEIGIKAENCINEGKLVSDEIIVKMVKNRLDENPRIPGYIMDGFPRTLSQAESLSRIKVDSEIAIFLKVNEEKLIERLTSRLYCDKCGAVYNLLTNPPKVQWVCDKCGNNLTKRSDDKREVVKKRIDIFLEETLPVIEFYKQKGSFFEIEATGTIDTIFNKIEGVLS